MIFEHELRYFAEYCIYFYWSMNFFYSKQEEMKLCVFDASEMILIRSMVLRVFMSVDKLESLEINHENAIKIKKSRKLSILNVQ